jgi:hypothetical protein
MVLAGEVDDRSPKVGAERVGTPEVAEAGECTNERLLHQILGNCLVTGEQEREAAESGRVLVVGGRDPRLHYPRAFAHRARRGAGHVDGLRGGRFTRPSGHAFS